MQQTVMSAIEHHYANQLLKEQEERHGHIEVYSVVINPDALVRSTYASSDAKKVTVNGTEGYLVVDEQEDYLRPDFICESALIQPPKLLKTITPIADKNRHDREIESERKAAQEKAEHAAQEQRLKLESERLNSLQLVNEKIADFNEESGALVSPMDSDATKLQIEAIDAALDKANALLLEHGPKAKRLFSGQFMNRQILSENTARTELLMEQGFEYSPKVENGIFTLKILDAKGNAILDFQAELMESNEDLDCVIHDEFDSKIDRIEVPVLKVDTENPLIHLEFGANVIDSPEKSFFLNEVDTLSAVESICFYEEDALSLSDFADSELVFDINSMDINDCERIFTKKDSEAITLKVDEHKSRKVAYHDYAPSI